MNTTMTTTTAIPFADFVKAHQPPGPGVTVRVSERTLDRAREALGLSASAEMPEIQAAMDKFAADLRAKEDAEHALLPVPRGGDARDVFGGLRAVGHALRHVRQMPGQVAR